MTKLIRFTGSTKAWTTSTWEGIDSVLHAVKDNKLDQAANILSYSILDMSSAEGWAEVGTATITVELYSHEKLVAKELEGLNDQLQQIRAANQQRENVILDRISKLQAITYDAPEETV